MRDFQEVKVSNLIAKNARRQLISGFSSSTQEVSQRYMRSAYRLLLKRNDPIEFYFVLFKNLNYDLIIYHIKDK